MVDKRLVIDANIVIRAVFGTRVPTLIASYCPSTAFYIAEPNLAEALHYIEQLGEKRGIDRARLERSIAALMQVIQIVPEVELASVRDRASARVARRDVDDWPAVAAAMVLDCPIWTEDADFFGSGVATWTSDTVELYLAGRD